MNEFATYVKELLDPFGVIRLRKMFGGYGLYERGKIFGIIAADQVYFKGDAENAKFYEDAGSRKFEYERMGAKIQMRYWYVPIEILEDEEVLGEWFAKACSSK